MNIPKNITAKHIESAMKNLGKIGEANWPAKKRIRKHVVLDLEKKPYPVKLVIAYANKYANGEILEPF